MVRMAFTFAVVGAVVLRVAQPAGADEVRPVQGAGSRSGIGVDRFRTPEEARAMRVAWNDDPRYRRGRARSLQVDFDPTAHAVGSVGLEVPPLRAHQGLTLWVHADACDARLRLRLWEADGDRWELPAVRLDFRGWREFQLDQRTTTFVARHRVRRDWDRIQQLQVSLEGAPCRLHLGELGVVTLDRADGGGGGR
jgi:hypothetical protein